MSNAILNWFEFTHQAGQVMAENYLQDVGEPDWTLF